MDFNPPEHRDLAVIYSEHGLLINSKTLSSVGESVGKFLLRQQICPFKAIGVVSKSVENMFRDIGGALVAQGEVAEGEIEDVAFYPSWVDAHLFLGSAAQSSPHVVQEVGEKKFKLCIIVFIS